MLHRGSRCAALGRQLSGSTAGVEHRAPSARLPPCRLGRQPAGHQPIPSPSTPPRHPPALQSDLLVNYLGEAEAHFRRQAQDPLFRPALHAGLLQPARPLQPDSLLVPRMRCYGATQTSVMGGRRGRLHSP